MQSWDQWISERSYIAGKLKAANPDDHEAFFLKVHATTEAFFRRVLLVGLRLNLVTFADADDWLNHNDSTPTKTGFPNQFNKLFAPGLSFESVIAGCPNGQTLWELWHDFSKPVRNHLAHGIRGYGPDWLECGVRINQCLQMELDGAMAKHLGGSIGDNLRKLQPRLPTGRSGVNIPPLLGLKKGRLPRPSVSLEATQNRLIAVGLLPSA
jgi:hypothetical protein